MTNLRDVIAADDFDSHFGVELVGCVARSDHVGEDTLSGAAEDAVAAIQLLSNVHLFLITNTNKLTNAK